MITIRSMSAKRFIQIAAMALLVGAGAFAPGTHALASGGNSTGVDAAAGTVINLSNFKQTFNGSSPKGKVTLGYSADGTAQSIDFNLSSINAPDGTVLPVQVVTGVYRTIVSYYSYQVVEYTTTSGTLTVKGKSVVLSLNKLNGDVVPDFPAQTVGTTEIRIFSPDGATEILGGTTGKLRP